MRPSPSPSQEAILPAQAPRPGQTPHASRVKLTDLPEELLARICAAADPSARASLFGCANQAVTRALCDSEAVQVHDALRRATASFLWTPGELRRRFDAKSPMAGLANDSYRKLRWLSISPTGSGIPSPRASHLAPVVPTVQPWTLLPHPRLTPGEMRMLGSQCANRNNEHLAVYLAGIDALIARTSCPLAGFFEPTMYLSYVSTGSGLKISGAALSTLQALVSRTFAVNLSWRDAPFDVHPEQLGRRSLYNLHFFSLGAACLQRLRVGWDLIVRDTSATRTTAPFALDRLTKLLHCAPQLAELDLRLESTGIKSPAHPNPMQFLTGHEVLPRLTTLAVSGSGLCPWNVPTGEVGFLISLRESATSLQNLVIESVSLSTPQRTDDFLAGIRGLGPRLKTLQLGDGEGTRMLRTLLAPDVDLLEPCAEISWLGIDSGDGEAMGWNNTTFKRFASLRPAPLQTVDIRAHDRATYTRDPYFPQQALHSKPADLPVALAKSELFYMLPPVFLD